MNRDQTIIKTIQKLLLKRFWKIEKQFKAFIVEAAQARNRPNPLGARDARAFGPTADGQAAKPARRRAPLGPKLARHRRVAPSPSDSDPTAARARRANKTGDGGDPGTLAFILSLPVFSLHETEAMAAGHGGRAEWAGRRHRGLLAGARARRWVSAPLSSSPWMAPRFRAHARAPRRPGGERRSILCRAPTKRAARVCPARGRPAVGRCR